MKAAGCGWRKEENTMIIHEELIANIQRADEAARAKEYRLLLLTLEHAEFKASLLAREECEMERARR